MHLGQGLLNMSATEMTLAEFVKQKPSAKRVKLTDCQVSLPDCVYESNGTTKVLETVFVPVHVPGQELPAHVVIKTDHYNGLVQKMIDAGESDVKVQALLDAHGDQLTEVRAFEGWVSDDRHGISSKMGKSATRDFIVIDHNGGPEWGVNFFVLLLGLWALYAAYNRHE